VRTRRGGSHRPDAAQLRLMRSRSELLSTLAYAAMILAAIAIFLIVRDYGETLVAPAPQTSAAVSPEPAERPQANTLSHVLLALAAVVVIGRLLGSAFARIGQPPVIGEVLGGIVLGPSLLGRVAPDVAAYVLPVAVAPYLSVVAQLGVILYMFLVGLDLNLDPLRSRARAVVATSHASILAPFVLGSLLALYLYPRVSTNDVPFTSFALFMGVAMSITAFPVLARILSDRGMTRSELGVIALACAAADDVTAWCLLAFVVGVVQSEVGGALLVAVSTLGFIAVMFFAVKPLVAKLVHRRGNGSAGQGTVALVLVLMLLSALTTEQIGVHAVFGAFLFGAIVPRETGLPRVLTGRLEDLVTILLLPAFFAFTGMRTEISLVSTAAEWAMCLLIIAVATIGKFGGTLVAARLTGMNWPGAAGLGILMNTRGLMELIVLNIGLDLGVISPALFTMMVIMALVTTIATTPLLEMLGGGILTVPASQTREYERRR
jgi:Kef-type K+ transport system membrane component KefB